MNTAARVLDSLDSRKLTPEIVKVSQEIRGHVDAAFRLAKDARLIGNMHGEEPNSARMQAPAHGATFQTGEMLAPERLADLFAERRGQAFTQDQLASFLKHNRLAAGRTFDQALAIWQGLENLAVAVAGWAAYRDWNRVCRISALDDSLTTDVKTFGKCNSGTEMLEFFGRCINRVLGKPETIIVANESLVNGYDPISAAAICSQFVGACVSTKRLLDHCPVDWTRQLPKLVQSMNSVQFHDLLVALGACREFLDWSAGKSLREFWQGCERADWMLWFCGRMMNMPGWPTRSEIVLAACCCAETVLPLYENKHAGQSDPRTAIETARAWANGKASLEEVRRAVAALDTVLMFNLPMPARNAVVAAHDAAAAAIATYSDETGANAARAAVAAEAGLFVFNRGKINKKLTQLVRVQLNITD
jgi:hypothetical protein